jgi:hypothetical protein
MSPKTADPFDPFDGLFKDYAPTVYILPGDKLIGRYDKVSKGPANEYGIPLVVTFTAEQGTAHTGPDPDSPVFDLESGAEYSLWLLTMVAKSNFAEGKPKPGERFAYTNHGKRASKTRKDKNGDPVEYHDFETVWLDRTVEDDTVDWDKLPE